MELPEEADNEEPAADAAIKPAGRGKTEEPTDNLRELGERRKTRTGMEQKAQEVYRIASPKDEVRTTLQTLHSRIGTEGKSRCQSTNHMISAKNREMGSTSLRGVAQARASRPAQREPRCQT